MKIIKFGDLVWLILEIWRYCLLIPSSCDLRHFTGRTSYVFFFSNCSARYHCCCWRPATRAGVAWRCCGRGIWSTSTGLHWLATCGSKHQRRWEWAPCDESQQHFFNWLKPRQDGRHFADIIFKCILLNENICISNKISLKYVCWGLWQHWFRLWLGTEQATRHYLNQWWAHLQRHVCVTQLQWVDSFWPSGNIWHQTSMSRWLDNCLSPVRYRAIAWSNGDLLSVWPLGTRKCVWKCCLPNGHFVHVSLLTHWGRVTHICVSELTIIGSDNGLSPGRRQAIIWNNAGMLLIGPLGTNFSKILIEIHIFSFKKMHLKMAAAKWRPFCLGSVC